jgi:hypothetical protein
MMEWALRAHGSFTFLSRFAPITFFSCFLLYCLSYFFFFFLDITLRMYKFSQHSIDNPNDDDDDDDMTYDMTT